MAPVLDKGYAVIVPTWKAGDRVDLLLPMRGDFLGMPTTRVVTVVA